VCGEGVVVVAAAVEAEGNTKRPSSCRSQHLHICREVTANVVIVKSTIIQMKCAAVKPATKNFPYFVPFSYTAFKNIIS
jgi:hypothetical protein